LLELAEQLERRLTGLERLDWALEECEPLERSSDERDVETIFARLPRINGMSAHARPLARELVRWREQTAARQNRPVQSVLSDAALIEVAKRAPSTGGELAKIRGVGAGNGQGRRAEELLAALGRGRESPPDPAPPRSRQPPSKPDDAPLVSLGEALLRTRAREAGLAYELLAARADLQAIVASRRTGGEADVRTLRGWRRELVGAELLDLLDGGVSLSVLEAGRGRRVQVEPRAAGP